MNSKEELIIERDKAEEMLVSGKFDGFDFVKFSFELHKLEGEKEVNRTLTASNGKNISTTFWGECFLETFYYYYLQFGIDKLEFHADFIADEKLKSLIQGFIEYYPTAVKNQTEEFTEYLWRIAQEQHFEIFKPFIPLLSSSDNIVNFINNNDFPKKKFVKFVGILIPFWFEHRPFISVSEIIETYNELAQILNNRLGCNVKKELYEYVVQFSDDFIDLGDHELPKDYLSMLEYDRMNLCKSLEIKDGTLEIPWDCVLFEDGYLLLYHPSEEMLKTKSYVRIKVPKAKAAFNEVSSLFIRQLPPIKTECRDGKIVKIIDLPDIDDCIVNLERKQLSPELELQKVATATRPLPITTDEAKESIKRLKDNRYLNYLVEHHIPSKKVYRCLEIRKNSDLVVNNEFAYIFILSQRNGKCVVAFENTKTDRVSIVFIIRENQFDKAIDTIYKYFASEEINKREMLAKQPVAFPESGIIRYKRIFHTNFEEWQALIDIYI